ncbi:MAG: type II toxin-antitoxin system death-on-curing family toxin [Deltaproteobacteria bacterium]|nr:type II toxin-antitoxin system death-on-curing family toxin [Deltaproteobacteria bacterium]
MIAFPTVDESLELHHTLLERFGGAAGIRDLGLLESALYRPQTGHYEDVIEMAAALMESLLINHAFVDGNKRTAYFLTDIFLRMNGWKIRIQPQAGYRFIMKLLSRPQHRFPVIEQWLRTRIVSATAP